MNETNWTPGPWETLYEALKEAASVLAAIHDAENGKVRADQGIVTLARRGCDEARLALAKARGEA